MSLELPRAWLIAILLFTLGVGTGIVSCEAMRRWHTWPWANGLPPPCYGPDIDRAACVAPAPK